MAQAKAQSAQSASNMGAQTYTLEMERIFEAPIERVWDAWTKPEIMALWNGPRAWPMAEAEGNLRVGGKWRARLHSDEGQACSKNCGELEGKNYGTPNKAGGFDLFQSGEYKVIEPMTKLVFTFGWESGHSMPGVETLITIQLEKRGNRTRMLFTQERMTDEFEVTSHRGGWTSAFGRLDDYFVGNL